MITVAGIGFFKTVDDMNAFAATPDGQNLGSNEGDRDFPVEVPFSGTDLNIGIYKYCFRSFETRSLLD